MGISFLAIVLCLFLAFLAFLGSLAMAATKSVEGTDARTRRGCLGGCAAAIVLVFLCALGAVGLAFFLTATATGVAVECNPIESISVERVHGGDTGHDHTGHHGSAPGPLELVPPGAPIGSREAAEEEREDVRVTFEVRGEFGQELFEMLAEHLSHNDLPWPETTRQVNAAGEERTTYVFTLPSAGKNLYELEAEIEHELDGLRIDLPEGVHIEFKEATLVR